MKSIKPGRGPSFMGGITSIAIGIFGIIWTIIAAGMGGGMFALFGIVFIAIAVINAVYSFKNATSENRYSAFDITEGDEEPDPFNERFGESIPQEGYNETANRFCPYCGNPVEEDFEYCNSCGKKLP